VNDRHRNLKFFFVDAGASAGTDVDSVDFGALSEFNYEAELAWGSSGRMNSRQFVNVVPRNARNIVMECNYCRLSRDLVAEPLGGWQWRDSYSEWRRRYRFVLKGKAIGKRWVTTKVDPVADDGSVLGRARIAILSETHYPFSTDGRNARPGDLLLCSWDNCSLSLMILEMDESRLTKVRYLDLQKDARELYRKLANAHNRGKLELLRQNKFDREETMTVD